MKQWIAFFSQTGTEILNISNKLNVFPSLIVTNKEDYKQINFELYNECYDRIEFLPKKPTLNDYIKLINKYQYLFDNAIITLNGYLRIIPEELCNRFNIYNLHPGLITKYPSLKGFNPQEVAYVLNLPTSGCVIHKVTPELDSGEILKDIEVDIKGCTLDEVYSKLHDAAEEIWIDFLIEELSK